MHSGVERMRINVKSQTLDGYNFQNNGFRTKIQTVSKSALKNTSLKKKKIEIREGRGKVHFSRSLSHYLLWS